MNILLIHGLGRTPLSLWGMANALKKAGHTTEFFGYVTMFQSFDEIAFRLRDRLRNLSTRGPYGIVSHSMGGILTRAALATADFALPAHVVMLAPPNRSPKAARLANRLPPFRWFANQSGHNMASQAFYEQLPTLACSYTLVAGTVGPTGALSPFGEEVNDLIVGMSEIRMRSHDPIVQIPALHSFIMNHELAQRTTIEAFASSA
ncbi:MAG: alpha/beta fold hydrolase [Cyanobacteria bacterium J06621_11]